MTRLRQRQVLRRVVGMVLLALLAAQWTVLAHSIQHAPAAVDAPRDIDQALGHHAGTAACHLVDHLLTGQAPGAQAATAAGLPPGHPRLAAAAASLACGPVFPAYEARAPPRG